MKTALTLLLSLSFAAPAMPAQETALPTHAQDAVVEKNAPPAPAKAAPDHSELQKVEDRWSDAVTKRDQYGLELVLAPQLVDIAATGDVTNRNQQIVALFKKDSPILSLEQKVISVRYLADAAVAVVNGTYVFHTKVEGTKRDDKGIFTHVFTHSRAGWLCVSSQRTQVVEQVLTKPKAQKSGKGELPFKIPLIHDSTPHDSTPKQ